MWPQGRELNGAGSVCYASTRGQAGAFEGMGWGPQSLWSWFSEPHRGRGPQPKGRKRGAGHMTCLRVRDAHGERVDADRARFASPQTQSEIGFGVPSPTFSPRGAEILRVSSTGDSRGSPHADPSALMARPRPLSYGRGHPVLWTSCCTLLNVGWWSEPPPGRHLTAPRPAGLAHFPARGCLLRVL